MGFRPAMRRRAGGTSVEVAVGLGKGGAGGGGGVPLYQDIWWYMLHNLLWAHLRGTSDSGTGDPAFAQLPHDAVQRDFRKATMYGVYVFEGTPC